jgi:hypothetical protein
MQTQLDTSTDLFFTSSDHKGISSRGERWMYTEGNHGALICMFMTVQPDGLW